MRQFRFCFLLLLVAVTGTSCASIVTRNIYPVNFDSEPQGAHLTIENRDRKVVFDGWTPATVMLEASAGYMRRENYKVTYRQPGREPVTTNISATLNGWYFGNLLFGGWIGMLIVDPLSGAMYKIPQQRGVVTVAGEEAEVAGEEAGQSSGRIPVRRIPSDTGESLPAQEWVPLGE